MNSMTIAVSLFKVFDSYGWVMFSVIDAELSKAHFDNKHFHSAYRPHTCYWICIVTA